MFLQKPSLEKLLLLEAFVLFQSLCLSDQKINTTGPLQKGINNLN